MCTFTLAQKPRQRGPSWWDMTLSVAIQWINLEAEICVRSIFHVNSAGSLHWDEPQ